MVRIRDKDRHRENLLRKFWIQARRQCSNYGDGYEGYAFCEYNDFLRFNFFYCRGKFELLKEKGQQIIGILFFYCRSILFELWNGKHVIEQKF